MGTIFIDADPEKGKQTEDTDLKLYCYRLLQDVLTLMRFLFFK